MMVEMEMNEEKMGFDSLFNKTVEFRNCELIAYEKGNVTVRTVVNETDTNPYGIAHGGYLYTLCDSLAGLVGYSLGNCVVSLQGNINYIRQAKVGDELLLIGKTVHDGKSTKVVETQILCEDKVICKCSFTLFNVGKVKETPQE